MGALLLVPCEVVLVSRLVPFQFTTSIQLVYRNLNCQYSGVSLECILTVLAVNLFISIPNYLAQVTELETLEIEIARKYAAI